jgi:YHS domain-containing protein
MQRRQFLSGSVAGALGLWSIGCGRDDAGKRPVPAPSAQPSAQSSATAAAKAETVPAATAAADPDELQGCGEIHDEDAVLTAGQPLADFEGCKHASIEAKAQDIVRQPGAKTGDATHCPVSGHVFRVAASSPKREVAGKPLFFCCEPCAKHFSAHSRQVLKQRGMS